MHDIFISYSRRNLEEVQTIKEGFERDGFSCWMDLEGIESGSEEFTEKLAEAIGGSTAVLFFLSKASQESRWSLNELRVARDEGKHVVIVRFNDDAMTIKFKLEFGGSDFIDWRQPEQKEKLLRDLRRWVGKPKREVPPGRPSARPSAHGLFASPRPAVTAPRLTLGTAFAAAKKLAAKKTDAPPRGDEPVDASGFAAGRKAFGEGRHAEALAIFRKAAAKGERPAMLALAGCLLKGIGGRADLLSARLWQARAKASSSDVEATMASLGPP